MGFAEHFGLYHFDATFLKFFHNSSKNWSYKFKVNVSKKLSRSFGSPGMSSLEETEKLVCAAGCPMPWHRLDRVKQEKGLGLRLKLRKLIFDLHIHVCYKNLIKNKWNLKNQWFYFELIKMYWNYSCFLVQALVFAMHADLLEDMTRVELFDYLRKINCGYQGKEAMVRCPPK